MRRSRHSPGARAGAAALAAAATLCAAGCQRTRLTQVLPPGARIDVFPQVSRPQLDALFVVDDSRYMAVHQKRVADSFGRFLAWLDLNQIDYHLGLLSADVSASPGVYLGGGADQFFSGAEAQALPAAVLALGGSGAAISPVLQQLDLALRAPPAGFLRPAAALFLVVVTDNNDPWSPGSDPYYFRTLKAAKGQGNDGVVTLSALAGDLPSPDHPAGGCSIPDPQNPSQSFSAEAAPRLAGLVQQVGGRFRSLCTPDFDAVFDELGASAAGLKRSFRLALVPDPATLLVTVRAACDTRADALGFCAQVADACSESDPALLCTPRPAQAGPPAVDGWSYDPATLSIVFSGKALPPRGSTVEVQYQEKGP